MSKNFKKRKFSIKMKMKKINKTKKVLLTVNKVKMKNKDEQFIFIPFLFPFILLNCLFHTVRNNEKKE